MEMNVSAYWLRRPIASAFSTLHKDGIKQRSVSFLSPGTLPIFLQQHLHPSHAQDLKKYLLPRGVEAHPITLEAEAEKLSWIQGLPGLHSEFQTSQSYTAEPCLRTPL